MKFSEMKYERPDINVVGRKFNELMVLLRAAQSFEEQDDIMKEIISLMSEYESMNVIASIKFSNYTNNKSYSDEQNYFDINNPFYENCKNEYYKTLSDSEFRSRFENKYGKQLFRIAGFISKSISPEIVEDLQNENQLISEYIKFKSSAKIMFDGKERNLQELSAFMKDKDREVRKHAHEGSRKFFSDAAWRFDEMFDKLVNLRNEMALKLGFKNFKELGYARMRRSDYHEDTVTEFRNNIIKYIVPLSVKLREKQRIRTGTKKLMTYDLPLLFRSGNPEPKGNPEWILNNSRIMYDKMSLALSEFFDFMMKNELMDVHSRLGKAGGGFCDFISKHKSPYIFTNMNGTSDDLSIFIHETGHAFQRYKSRNFELLEYIYPTEDACEIHSMSLEFLTYPWMFLFFKEDTEKYKYLHLNRAIDFMPHVVMIDDFQHWIYENPSATPVERNSKWREKKKIYMPDLDDDDDEQYEKGGGWKKSTLIFKFPFYSIDYCLAQICSFQFWSKSILNDKGEFEKSLKDYIRLCEAGGSMSFLELVKYANLESPFEENVIRKVAEEVETYIDKVDDTSF